MVERQLHWGNISAAEALLQKGERIETERFPFDNIAIDKGLEAVKDEVETVCDAHSLDCRGLTPV